MHTNQFLSREKKANWTKQNRIQQDKKQEQKKQQQQQQQRAKQKKENRTKEKNKQRKGASINNTLRKPLSWTVMGKENVEKWVFACYSCHGIWTISKF